MAIKKSELYSSLWSSCDELRGGMDASQYAPSALLLGFSAAGRVLHFQVSFADSVFTKIITIYEPDPSEWIEHRKRR